MMYKHYFLRMNAFCADLFPAMKTYFWLTDLFFNKSIDTARLLCVCVCVGGGGYVSIKLSKYFQTNWIKYIVNVFALAKTTNNVP